MVNKLYDEKLLNSIKKDEGFSGERYLDNLGYPTIGYGTKLPLSKEEATLILEHRLGDKITKLINKKPFITDLPHSVQQILYNMSYQMGVGGVLKFKRMWKALESRDYTEASFQMLDSLWAKQTPTRAINLADRMRKA